jgi:hypothetical protein
MLQLAAIDLSQAPCAVSLDDAPYASVISQCLWGYACAI